MSIMTLSETDLKILSTLTEGRNVAVNIAERIQRDRSYISKRLKKLEKENYVQNIGKESSGLYDITDNGEKALNAYNEYKDQLEQLKKSST